jgi:choice-of-anchor B domain-containing protein
VYSFRNAATGKWDAYAYVTTEALQGLQIINLSALPARVSLARTDHEITTSHTAFVANVDFATAVAKPGLTPVLYVEGADNRLARPNPFPRTDPRPKRSGCGNRACGKDIPGANCSCGSGCSCMSGASTANKGFHAFSLQNPRDPRIVGSYTDTYMHDVYVETFSGARASQCAPGHNPCEVVFGWTGQDFRIIDFTDKTSPRVLSTLIYPNLGYPHSGWISRNKQWLFGFDELDELNGGLQTRILSFKIDNFRNPQVRAQWTGPTSAIDHNGYVVDNKLYVSSYTRGLRIMDVQNPSKPREIGSFDTHPENDSTAFAGAWGAYPFLPSGNILVSDINRGLFIVKEQP